MSDLPEPLTPPDCDLTDFQYMELDVRRLRDSKFSASVDGEAFRAGVLLWCAAWHQIPAASLPDDDIELANLAGYGRVIKEWKKARIGALTGFVKCSDGRLYHPVIAEKAVAAYAAKQRHSYGKLLERLRKENKKRGDEKAPLVGVPTFEQWKSGDYPSGIPPERPKSSAGIPPENALKGNGEGTEQNGEGKGDLPPSVPNGTGADAPPGGLSANEALFQVAVPWLVANGGKESNVRSLLGGAIKHIGAESAWELASQCMREKPMEPIAWLAGGLNDRIAKLKGGAGKSKTLADQQQASTEEARKLLFGNQGEVIDA